MHTWTRHGASGRRLVFWVLVVIAAILLVEGSSWLAFRFLFGERFDFEKAARLKRERIAAAATIATRTSGADTLLVVPHPYLGFVSNPRFEATGGAMPVSEWGFLDDKLPLRARVDGEVVVGVFGGSVAFWLSVRGIDAMIEELSKLPRFRGKRFVIVRTAQGGLKQPQQLMTLNFLLAQGGHFDLVVNVDGFNEVALPPISLVSRQIFPFFPRGWPELLGQGGDPQALLLTGRVVYLQQRVAERAGQFSRRGLRNSIFANTVWRLLDRGLEVELAQARHALETYAAPGAQRTFSGYGPLRQYRDPLEMHRDLVAVWRQSSLQMHQLCAANGIRYFHFLQPNQYLGGSKPMSAAERQVAILAGHPFERDVPVGYPLMIAAGRHLAARGVAFEDLSGLFARVTEPLYIDNCCHVNDQGNQMLGRAMGRRMAAALAR